MPVTDPIQTSFIGGELSPRLHGAVGSELYKKSLKTARNWMITQQGSALTCPGTRDRAAALGTSSVLRFVPPTIQISGRKGAMLDIGEHRLQIINCSDYSPLNIPAYNLLLNPAFDGHAGLQRSAYWSVINGADVETAGLYATIYGDGSSEVSQGYLYVDAGTYTVNVYISRQSVEHFYAKVYNSAGALVTTGTRTVGALDVAGGTLTFTFVASGYDTFRLRFTADGTDYEVDGLGARVRVTSAQVNTPARTFVVTPWTAAEAKDVQIAVDTNDATYVSIYFAHRAYPAFVLRRAYAGGVVSGAIFRTQLSSIVPEEYVSAVAFFKSRLWFGGMDRIFGSAIGDYENWTETYTPPAGATFNVNDPIDVRVTTYDNVRWLRGHRDTFMAGFNASEWASRDPIAPAPTFRQESGFGSSRVVPTLAGGEMLYASSDGKKVRGIEFSFEKDNWGSQEITFVADHLLRESALTELHYLRTAETLVGLRADGSLACCTYSREREVVAWWRRTFGGGATVKAAAAADNDDGCVLWLVVDRGVSGARLETLDLSDTIYTDGYTGPGTGTAIPTPTFVTLPPESGWPRGTAQGKLRHWPEVYLRLNDTTTAPLVNGERAILDETGDYKANTLGSGNGVLTITQDTPGRTEVLAVLGGVQTGGL